MAVPLGRDKLELWLWAHGIVGAHAALTDDELIAAVGGKHAARRDDVQQSLRAGAKGGKAAPYAGLFGRGTRPAIVERVARGEPVPHSQQVRLWFIPAGAPQPSEVARILRKRAAQRERNASRDREARNTRDRQLYAESTARRERSKQSVYRWRKFNVRSDVGPNPGPNPSAPGETHRA